MGGGDRGTVYLPGPSPQALASFVISKMQLVASVRLAWALMLRLWPQGFLVSPFICQIHGQLAFFPLATEDRGLTTD